jgi:single-strand DNA-binding protein
MNLNRVQLAGRLTRDPEIKYTTQGTAIADISLAVNRVWKDDSGEKKQEVTFVEITFWSRLAEITQQYLKKGSPAYIEGRLQLDTWQDKQTNQKRSRMRVVAESLQMLGGRDDSGSGPASPTGSPQRQTAAPPARAAAPPPQPQPEPDWPDESPF